VFVIEQKYRTLESSLFLIMSQTGVS